MSETWTRITPPKTEEKNDSKFWRAEYMDMISERDAERKALKATNEKIDELGNQNILLEIENDKLRAAQAEALEGMLWCGASEVLLKRQLNHEDVTVRMTARAALEFIQHMKDLIGVGESND